jgi:protein gp37
MVLSTDYWKQPAKWDAAAAKAGERHRVFCSSMADVFEDHPTVAEQRARLWPLIEATPNLDWLLLTKRPENIMAMVPEAWRAGFPANVWQGATTENQDRYHERWEHLRAVPARVRFLSVEPMLGYLRLYEDARELLHWLIEGGESGPDAKRREMDIGAASDLARQALAMGVKVFVKQDSGRKSGEQGRIPQWMWDLKEFPVQSLVP